MAVTVLSRQGIVVATTTTWTNEISAQRTEGKKREGTPSVTPMTSKGKMSEEEPEGKLKTESMVESMLTLSSRPETGDQCVSAEARLQGPAGVDASYGEVKARSATMLMGDEGDLATAWYEQRNEMARDESIKKGCRNEWILARWQICGGRTLVGGCWWWFWGNVGALETAWL